MKDLITGTLPRTGDAYTLSLLDEGDLEEIGRLHDTVIRSLPPAEKSFLLPRAPEYFARHFARGRGSAVLGARSGGALIAKTLILHPGPGETTPEQLGGAVLISTPETTSIMQAASVHPSFRGNGLMAVMVRRWLSHAQEWGRSHVLAETEIHNRASWSLFLKEGLEIVRVGKSPVDGADVYNVREGHAPPARERIKYAISKVLGFSSPAAGAATARCGIEDIETQKKYFRDGYIIAGMDGGNNTLILEKRGTPETA